ncbi:hypothetical protein AALB_0653 [Agarivorans albus MKT 106]|uniref:Uncharacterized protein n=1 Tax=Agarivorans albus MKT 106 TaxID=1331007 RepID=R9PH40_AGAAL|nr:hypothetical protein AALB_0653 [Agarivorans albus MKT 106]
MEMLANCGLAKAAIHRDNKKTGLFSLFIAPNYVYSPLYWLKLRVFGTST